MSYDLPWANASNTPFRLFKHFVHEGGISTPLALQWPAQFGPGGINHTPCHAIDILPTILDAADVAPPAELAGRPLRTIDGESLLPLLRGRRWQREQALHWEHEGNCALRQDNLKLVRQYQGDWELYDLERDRTELRNLAPRNRSMVGRMARDYQQWADRVGVVDWNVQLPKLQKAWGMKDIKG
jgi:arylsulfatase